jgi:hypothetical protein
VPDLGPREDAGGHIGGERRVRVGARRAQEGDDLVARGACGAGG